MMSKVCIHCNIEKEDSEFKYGNTCGDCIKEYKHQHYLANKDKYKNKAHTRYINNKESAAVYNKAYRILHKEELKIKSKIRRLTSIGHLQNNIRTKRYLSTDLGKLKFKVRKQTRIAIEKGILIKPLTCSRCNKEGTIEAHHPDYTKALDIVWLCKQCHENEHHLNEGQ